MQAQAHTLFNMYPSLVIRRVDAMEDSQITRGRGRPRKTIRETIRKDLEINDLDQNMVYDRTL
jgi:hypothetical protein